ncbi:MAG: HupE/UreJ family protein [Acidobacteriota bacterium]
MLKRCWLALLPLPLAAHMVSMSTGEVRVTGNRARYELRMPLYEIAHVRNPERALVAQVRFRGARLVEVSCREDATEGAYYCSATYEFPAPVEQLEVECTLHAVTVPNHVHLMRAVRGNKTDQAVFDLSFPTATIRFEPPTAWETALTQLLSGALRAAGGAAQLLFLASLALAARSRRELAALAAMFLAGESISCLAVLAAGWQPAPRFVEAAAALTIAYLAVEILLLPRAGQRWLVLGVLGAFHGLYFALFVRTSEYHAAYVLGGAALAGAALIALFAMVFARLRTLLAALRPVQVSAAALLVVGLGWFFLRVRG